MIAFTFALPEESQDFVKLLPDRRCVGARDFVGKIGEIEVLVAHTGVGLTSAAERVRELLETHSPTQLITAGYAGGLDPKLRIGDLVFSTNFSTPALLEFAHAQFAATPRVHFGGLTSQSVVADSIAAKTRLSRESSALAVDMETAAIAAECAAANVPLLSVRVISDAAGDPLPVPMERWFDLQKQRPRILSLLTFLVTHPSRIAPFTRFVRALAPARHRLTETLSALSTHL